MRVGGGIGAHPQPVLGLRPAGGCPYPSACSASGLRARGRGHGPQLGIGPVSCGSVIGRTHYRLRAAAGCSKTALPPARRSGRALPGGRTLRAAACSARCHPRNARPQTCRLRARPRHGSCAMGGQSPATPAGRRSSCCSIVPVAVSSSRRAHTSMRFAPTAPEAALWRALRGRQLGGVQFRRQVPLGGRFIADFARAARAARGRGRRRLARAACGGRCAPGPRARSSRLPCAPAARVARASATCRRR